MADTLGDMIDKLTISNIKLWHIEDERREYRKNNKNEESRANELLDMTAKVNKERNCLIDQINAAMAVLIDGGSFNLTSKDLLGIGKNKFYKGEKDA